MDVTLVVMAAGLGSRFGGLKQLARIGPSGERLMDYALFDARRAGVHRVVFVIRRELEREVHEAFGAHLGNLMQVTYAHQELDDLPEGFSRPAERTAPWGTGHAVLAARQAVQGPFLVINADDFYGPESFRVMAHHLSAAETPNSGEDHAMVGFRLRNTLSEHGTVSRGVCVVDETGYLSHISEHRALAAEGRGAVEQREPGAALRFSGDEPVSLNFWGFRPSIFAELQRGFSEFVREHGSLEKSEFALPTAIDKLIATRRASVRVLESPDTWFGVTYAEDKAKVVRRVEALVQQGVYPKALFG